MKKQIDWDAIRAAVENIHSRAVERPAAAVLRERARALARLEAQPAKEGAALELIEADLGGERYAFELGAVHAVVLAREVTPAPGASPKLIGVMNVRSRIVPLFSLRRLLGLEDRKSSSGSPAAILFDAENELAAVAADRIVAITSARPEDFTAPPQLQSELVRGVAPDGLILLDTLKLTKQLTVEET